MLPATRKKAAADTSRGTTHWRARTRMLLSTEICRSPPTSITGNSSIRSVWSRVGTGSTTVVVPEAERPANKTALLTCAEAMGRR